MNFGRWFSENPILAYCICGFFLGIVFTFFSKQWPSETMIVVGVAAFPHIINLLLGRSDKPMLPDWVIIGSTLILAAFACGSILMAITGTF